MPEEAVRAIVVTGDDFGASLAVDEAIERAHREGVLNTASLMVAEEAASDAVSRAQRMPRLNVGLHISVVCGRSALPPEQIPDLVDGAGRFSSHLVSAGFNFMRPAVRRQLESEIRAQFQRFAATGLRLDHVNAHNHMHLHPLVAHLIIEIGPSFGMRAVRLPYDPTIARWSFLNVWVHALRRRLQRAHIAHNDFVFGLRDTGRMWGTPLHTALERLPAGTTEIYFHPSEEGAGRRELEALVAPDLKERIAATGARIITFGELSEHALTA